MVVDITGDLLLRTAEFSPAEIDRIRRMYPTNAGEILAADAARYRETIRGLLRYNQPGADTAEWGEFVTLRGQYSRRWASARAPSSWASIWPPLSVRYSGATPLCSP